MATLQTVSNGAITIEGAPTIFPLRLTNFNAQGPSVSVALDPSATAPNPVTGFENRAFFLPSGNALTTINNNWASTLSGGNTVNAAPTAQQWLISGSATNNGVAQILLIVQHTGDRVPEADVRNAIPVGSVLDINGVQAAVAGFSSLDTGVLINLVGTLPASYVSGTAFRVNLFLGPRINPNAPAAGDIVTLSTPGFPNIQARWVIAFNGQLYLDFPQSVFTPDPSPAANPNNNLGLTRAQLMGRVFTLADNTGILGVVHHNAPSDFVNDCIILTGLGDSDTTTNNVIGLNRTTNKVVLLPETESITVSQDGTRVAQNVDVTNLDFTGGLLVAPSGAMRVLIESFGLARASPRFESVSRNVGTFNIGLFTASRFDDFLFQPAGDTFFISNVGQRLRVTALGERDSLTGGISEIVFETAGGEDVMQAAYSIGDTVEFFSEDSIEGSVTITLPPIDGSSLAFQNSGTAITPNPTIVNLTGGLLGTPDSTTDTTLNITSGINIQDGGTAVGTGIIQTLNFGDGVAATIDSSNSNLVNIVGDQGDGLRFLDDQGDVLGIGITSLMLGSGVSGSVSDNVGTISTVIPAGVPEIFFHANAAETTWTINHNLGQRHPVVTVYDSTNNVVLPMTIVGTSPNQLTITFPVATAGFATMIG